MSYSYSYKSSSSSGGSGMPTKLGNDAEFQAAKMKAMLGAPIGGGSGSSSYHYESSNSSSALPMRSTVSAGGLSMDAEMERMKREMEMNSGMPSNLGSGNSSYSYHSESTSGGSSATPRLIPLHEENRTGGSSGGTSVKKVVTTTTTKTNPQAVRELESIERDFSRIGRAPDNYHDDFDKLKREVLSGEAYKGDTSIQQPVAAKVREEYTKTSRNTNSASPRLIPVSVEGGRRGSGVESTTTTTTRTYTSGSDGPTVTEEKVVQSSESGGLHSSPQLINSETFIPIKTYDNTFDDFHMNRWMDQKDHFGSLATHDLDTQRMEWESRLGGIKSGFLSFPSHQDSAMANTSTIESSRTVSKRRPLRRSQSCRSTRTYFMDCVSVSKNPLGKPEFAVQFEMRDFNPGDISISTRNGKLIIKAVDEKKIGSSVSKKEFSRTVDLPADVQINLMRSVYSRDGILSITAPIKPPIYNPRPNVTSYSSSFEQSIPKQTASNWSSPPSPRTDSPSGRAQQPATTLNVTSSSAISTPKSLSRASSSTSCSTKPEKKAASFSFHESVVGYDPEDIHVTVTGRKVKVHAKHVETTPGGRRIHNEFTKMFDLPANYETVECYIKDGRTLYIVPSLRDDIEGSFVFINIEYK